MNRKPRLLINLPPTFFTTECLRKRFSTLRRMATVRTRSHNTANEMAPDIAWADFVMMWSWPVLDDALLDRAGHLAWVGQINTTRTAAQCCLKRGLPLSEVRHCWSPAVAEMALTLILTGLRRVSDYHAAMRCGKERWVGDLPADIDPRERELTGRAVGIVGFGAIGQRLAHLLAPFQTPVQVYDPFIPDDTVRGAGAQKCSLATLLRRCEVVVLCAANTAQAQHLLGERQIALLRPGSLLVNVGRSMLVDTDALLKRLHRNDLVAMLDVFDTEPLEKNSPLRRLPNVYCTPHRAGGVLGSLDRALAMLTGDLECVLTGASPRFAVTETMLPCFGDG